MTAPAWDIDDAQLAAFRQLARGMSHDLSGPIQIIRSVCVRAARDGTDEQTAESLLILEAEFLRPLSDYVVDMGRLAGGELTRARVDPDEVMHAVVESVRARPKWRGVQLEIRGVGRPFTGDGELLERAMVAVVEAAAARRLSQERPAPVEVAVTEHDPSHISFVVGNGTPSGRDGTIEAGQWAEVGAHPGHRGVALSLARCVARAHGGHLRVGPPESGVDFLMTVPRNHAEV